MVDAATALEGGEDIDEAIAGEQCESPQMDNNDVKRPAWAGGGVAQLPVVGARRSALGAWRLALGACRSAGTGTLALSSHAGEAPFVGGGQHDDGGDRPLPGPYPACTFLAPLLSSFSSASASSFWRAVTSRERLEQRLRADSEEEEEEEEEERRYGRAGMKEHGKGR